MGLYACDRGFPVRCHNNDGRKARHAAQYGKARANVLCFTTGRGSAYGCKPTPSIKLATNTPMYERMIDDMDINCGDILDGVTLQEKGEQIFQEILAVASGKKTKSEELGYGDNEFVPWQIGATM